MASFVTVALLLWAQTAAAESQIRALSGDLSGLSDQEVDRRYGFIKERLDQGQRNSRIWQYGFSSSWGIGFVIGVTQASLAGDKIDRSSGIVSAVKAAGGLAQLLWSPNPGYRGSEALRLLPAANPYQRLQRLAAAESLLRDVEDRALERTSWKSHAANAATNLIGGGVILGVGRAERAWDDALLSFGLGVVSGEVMLFTMPWRGVKDAADYRERLLTSSHQPEVSWGIVPTMEGFSLQVAF